MVTFVLGVAIVVVEQLRPSPDDVGLRPADPLSDDRATAQIVDAAVGVVRVANLADPAGATTLVSCKNSDEPPYQAVVDMTFTLPQGNSVGYLRAVADAMAGSGWRESTVTAEHFGHVLTQGGVTATVHRNTERTDLATMRLRGECRVTSDLRVDSSGWTEVTGRLRQPR